MAADLDHFSAVAQHWPILRLFFLEGMYVPRIQMTHQDRIVKIVCVLSNSFFITQQRSTVAARQKACLASVHKPRQIHGLQTRGPVPQSLGYERVAKIALPVDF